ncbi:Gfo/Idh/MocA family oxidoreductase [Actinomycetospora sp. NBRC 106378]|uniref:Gfo/Idh/MocA family oxidoreductase n=1 Tax=Actinomycetospora sp. NBRC 106378 TaxID=3032208 RepID=UPI0024A25D1C|nr:Gfo/Idh/MocA family oxidoreductase [Actinomycetospora sp. NBRC 106378]GLZ53484.1 dehydrogenase [Actinomycetospora sp. NBRC 106378]
MTRLATRTVRLALVGTGRIGTHHAEALARHVPGVELTSVVDPDAAAAGRLGDALEVPSGSDPAALLATEDLDGVVICAPARFHADLVIAALEAGKHVFVEKPMATTLADADRVVAAADTAGTVLQVGFNRRFSPGFAAARRAVVDGQIGTPQLLRSLTRDPGPFTADPTRIPQWTIFLETLIHDFDTLCWLNPGATPTRVNAMADALVRPDAKASGHLDTAVVTITFDNGAIATAEASFSALYGYDVRAEVFGSAGMVTAGDGRATDMILHLADGRHVDTSRADTDLLHTAYVGEFAAFADAIRAQQPAVVGARDARTALEIAHAAIRSIENGTTVTVKDLR